MNGLLCDSGPLIASFNPGDQNHARSVALLARWPGQLLVPEPVLGETCNFLRNNLRGGPMLEVRLLEALTYTDGDFEIVDPTSEDRLRAADLAARLVSGPVGYVDATIIAMAERLKVRDIATVDFKMVGMMSPVCTLKPLNWVLQDS